MAYVWMLREERMIQGSARQLDRQVQKARRSEVVASLCSSVHKKAAARSAGRDGRAGGACVHDRRMVWAE